MKKRSALAPVGDDAAAIKQRFDALFNRANKTQADERDVSALRGLLRDHKDLELWRGVVEPNEAMISYLLQQRIAGAALSEAWGWRVDEMRREMGHDAAPVVERLLIQHVILCWLQLTFIELKYAAVLGSDGYTRAQGAHWDRRVTLAQKRFTRAIETLARTRAMLRAAQAIDERREQIRARTPQPLRAVPDARAS